MSLILAAPAAQGLFCAAIMEGGTPGFAYGRRAAGGVAQMQDYWAALALAGDPNAATPLNAKRPRWDRLTAAKPVTLVFGNDATAQVKGQPRSAMCSWSAAF